jgi:4-aminobutyrate aminotransferase
MQTARMLVTWKRAHAGTGTEACESAVKLARHETGKQAIIYFRGSFHGRSLGALAMTSSKYVYGVNYGPLPSGFYQAPFPYTAHSNGATEEQCGDAAIETLTGMFHDTVNPKDIAAVIIEPIQGEGGYVVPPKGFMKKLRQICDDNKILMICDEVQSGMGRTGKFWAFEHEGITPDIVVFAKGIASGLPLSGTLNA